jgi:hypothetical protein
MVAMKRRQAIVLAGLLAATTHGWAQEKAAPPSDTELRAVRQQVTTLRKQLAAARNELTAANTARQSLQVQFSAIQRQMEALATEVRGLRSNSVLDLNGYLTFDISSGYPTALFRGVNVQIVNGTGETQTATGTGNLIVGYNRPSTGSFICSLGVTESAAACQANHGLWAQSHKSGSHNIIGGDFNSYSSWGGLVLGLENALTAPAGTISGGARNRAEGSFASISGGSFNTASGVYGNVAGGFDNHAIGEYTTVGGGAQRTSSGQYDWAAGGLLQDR